MPKIRQFFDIFKDLPDIGELGGVSMDGKWYISFENGRYLHTDGRVHEGTQNESNNGYSGYFDTKEDAEAALKGWQSEASPPNDDPAFDLTPYVEEL